MGKNLYFKTRTQICSGPVYVFEDGGMRNRIIIWTIAVFTLVLLPPCGLCAETNAKYDAVAVQELKAAAPKTSEEFMRRLKSLLDNPTTNGMELARRIVGMDMTRWETPAGKGGCNRYEKCYVTPDYHYPDLTSDFMLAIDNRADNAGSFVLVTHFMDRGYYDQKDKEGVTYEKEICIKPALIKKNLGEPSSVKVKVSRDPDSMGQVSVVYIYITKTYKITLSYQSWGYSHSKADAFYENFDNHKDFCANVISIRINKD